MHQKNKKNKFAISYFTKFQMKKIYLFRGENICENTKLSDTMIKNLAWHLTHHSVSCGPAIWILSGVSLSLTVSGFHRFLISISGRLQAVRLRRWIEPKKLPPFQPWISSVIIWFYRKDQIIKNNKNIYLIRFKRLWVANYIIFFTKAENYDNFF